MKKNGIFTICLALLCVCAQAQDKNATIFTIAGKPVSVAEFEYVYTKNNINNQADFSEKSLTDYLELYKNFRLKVMEAETQKLDTITSLKNELEGYRKQLAKSFLTDKEISEQLIQEAYNRGQKEINVSHILVKCDENANPADTLAAYKKAMDIRKRLLKGDDFGKIAMETSDDPSAKQNKGEIGFFTVFQTVYPFETAAYSIKSGEISMPVRTQFGYHLLKLNSTRPAQGEVHVAHLLLKFPPEATDEKKNAIKARIDSIHRELKSGNLKWNDAVLAFTDDRTNRMREGEIQAFSTGKMVAEFEKASFALSTPGQISEPVKTNYGWHLIKLLDKKGIPTFNEVKNDLKKRVERDSRSSVAKSKLIERIKTENKYSCNEMEKNRIFSAMDSSLLKGAFNKDSLKINQQGTLFTLAGTNYGTEDFLTYVQKNARRRNDKGLNALMNEYFDNYTSQKCLDYEESQLELKKPEFRNLKKEYRDGILLFDLTDKEVWGKAVKDTIGLQKFHEQNKTKYMWNQRVDADIYNCTDEKICKAAEAMVKKNKKSDEITKKLDVAGSKSKVSVIHHVDEKGKYDVVDNTGWKLGSTPIKKLNDSTYQFINVNRVLEPEPKSLKDARGYVVSDYQEYLEKSWLASLREKYPIVVNQDAFRSLIKK